MKLLIADDDKVTRELLREVFEKLSFEVRLTHSGEDALRAIQQYPYEIVLSDIRMVELSGLQLLSNIKKVSPKSVVILMTGFGTMEGAIEAIQKGAFDYISKPFKLDQLKAIVDRAKEHWRALSSPASVKANESPVPPKTLIGKSPKIVEVYKTLARATLSPSHVLIVGESGTGKELVARAIHENSSRKNRKFVTVSCRELTEALLGSELFGANSDGETIFLDEVGDIPLSMQAKLLRLLQEGGSNPGRGRVIAATNRDLEKEVSQGRFSEDLFYQLKVILIELPPLRSRMEDLPELVNYFLARHSDRIGKIVSHVSDEAMRVLQGYPWPGNVRELEHAIERAITMTRTNILHPEDFPGMGSAGDFEGAAAGSLEAVEKAHILKVLEEANFNKSKAAQSLGIDRKTLHRKAQKYRIKLPEK